MGLDCELGWAEARGGKPTALEHISSPLGWRLGAVSNTTRS